jgi:triosephosphate isomerase
MYHIIGNWKMYLSYNQVKAFFTENNLGELKKHTLILCPSFDSLSQTNQFLKNSQIKLGAQDCSAFKPGAYTGQIFAQSLKELGCNYCIVGHSETRKYYHITNEEVAQKALQAVAADLIPIICIGESKEEYQQQKTIKVLEEQLKPILALKEQIKNKQIMMAYEPVWSIGTNIVPDNEYLEKIFSYLKEALKSFKVILIYGGSVDNTSIKTIKQVSLIQGFLIGRASTDFQELKKIVLSL